MVLVVMLTLKIWRSWYEREVFRGLTKEKPFICHNDYRTVGLVVMMMMIMMMVMVMTIDMVYHQHVTSKEIKLDGEVGKLLEEAILMLL